MTAAEALARPRCTCGHIIDVHAAMTAYCLGCDWGTPCQCQTYKAREAPSRAA